MGYPATACVFNGRPEREWVGREKETRGRGGGGGGGGRGVMSKWDARSGGGVASSPLAKNFASNFLLGSSRRDDG